MTIQTDSNGYTYSIIVPLFNEEENVNPLIKSVFETVGHDPLFRHLVLVDDGSRDRTVELVEREAEREERIRLVRHTENRGLGGAVRSGLDHAEADLAVYTDADQPFDLAILPRLLVGAGPRTIVTGYRMNRDEGLRRWLLSRVYNRLISLLFGLSVKDVNFACKVIPRVLIREAILESEGSFIDAEILLEARRFGLRIEQYPVRYYPRTRGESTLSRPGVIFFILGEMIDYLKRRPAGQPLGFQLENNESWRRD